MTVSSRTPEGIPSRCPVCGKGVLLEPSASSTQAADALCPHCGSLIWFYEPAHSQQVDIVESKKREIRDWVVHIAQLSKSATNANAYYQEILDGLVTMLAAVGGAIWTRDSPSPRLQCSYGIVSGAIAEHELLFEPAHLRLVQRAFADRVSVATQSAAPIRPAHDNGYPTELLLLQCLVMHKDQTVALVEIFQRTGTSLNVQRSYLRFLRQICDLAEGSPLISGGNAEA